MGIKEKMSSLTFRVTAIVLAVLVISSVLVGVFGYWLDRSAAIESSAEKAMTSAEIIASAVDADAFKEVLKTGKKNDFWYRFKEMIDKTKEENIDFKYLYVLDADYDKNVHYFAEGFSLLTAEKGEEEYDLGTKESVNVYDDLMFDQTIGAGVPSKTGLYSDDIYGIMVSGFAPIKDINGIVIGVVGIDISVKNVVASANAFGLKVIIGTVLLCILLGAGVTWYIRRYVGKPIQKVTGTAEKLAVGDLDVHLNAKIRDEIGDLIRSFQRIRQAAVEQANAFERVANGDLTVNVEPRSEKDTMGIALNKMLKDLNVMFDEIRSSAGQVAEGSGQMARGALEVAKGVAEQSSAVEQLSSTVEDVSNRTEHNTEMAEKAAVLANSVQKKAEKGSEQMEVMTKAVKEISEGGEAINRVIKIIEDIAEQTNILALNASVEAAHAGQHGKGFAVVAEEVRDLSQRSSALVKETETLILDTIRKTILGVKIADETYTSFNEILSEIKESSGIMNKIAEVSKEQNVSISQINTGVERVAGVVKRNNSTAEESAAASQEISAQAEVLEKMLAKFKIHVSH